jgi:hypothetical protein
MVANTTLLSFLLAGSLLVTHCTPWAEIHQPKNHSVVRRQSVEMDIESNIEEFSHDVDGVLAISVDGKIITQIRQNRISVILADEAAIQEGVHEVRAVFRYRSGHDVVCECAQCRVLYVHHYVGFVCSRTLKYRPTLLTHIPGIHSYIVDTYLRTCIHKFCYPHETSLHIHHRYWTLLSFNLPEISSPRHSITQVSACIVHVYVCACRFV